jgi:undecaprenyl diphosphate synthase
LLRFYLKNEIKDLAKNKIRLRFIGDPEPLDKDIKDLMVKAELDTAQYDDFHLIIALNYGARDELRHAAQHLSEQVKRGSLDPVDITEEMVSAHLYTKLLPDPDLLIRPGGEIRVSNFLLWQIAYAEFYFTDVLWPDFDKEHFMGALTEFAKRKRRFGGYDSEDGQ